MYSAILDHLKNTLSEKRLLHTLSVAKECDERAVYFPLTEEERISLHTAALLHDITRELDTSANLEILFRNGVTLDPTEPTTPAILHARSGAYLARELFAVNDTVFSAIDAHTTGKVDMSVIDKLVFLCDFIEERREYPACRKLRREFTQLLNEYDAQTALDIAVLANLDSTIDHLQSKNITIASRTLEARKHLLSLSERNDTKK